MARRGASRAPKCPSASTMASTQIRYAYQQLFVAADLARRRLPLIRARADAAGPTLWLTACAHGDEVGGIAVIHEVFRRLRKQPLARGALCAFPMMNPFGFELGTRHLPLGNEDLNRAFPGLADGSLSQRIAYRVFETIKASAPDLVLDLHNDWLHSIPYTLVDPPLPGQRAIYERTLRIASHLGLLVVSERANDEEARIWQSTLSGALMAQGIPALTVELGAARIIDEAAVQHGVAMVFNALHRLGMIAPLAKTFVHPSLETFGQKLLHYQDRPFAMTSGIVRFHVRAGERVQVNQLLARTYNAFGKVLERLRATDDGIVLGHADTSVALPGVPLLAFAIPDLPELPTPAPPGPKDLREDPASPGEVPSA